MKETSSIPADEALDRRTADALAALAHPVRLRILRELAAEEYCCCKDVVERFPLAQSTVSQHLRVLVNAGILQVSRDAQRSRYTLNRDQLDALTRAVGALAAHCCAARPNQKD